jgi:hypothetical protein
MTLDRLILNPDSFRTIYLRKEDNIILKTEKGNRLVIKKIIPEEWTPTRFYDYEFEVNENKRNILLIDKQYLPVIEKDLKRLFRE